MTESPVTQAERHFIINNAYKRSRRYFDIVRLNHMEHQQEVERRVPLTTKQTIQSRVGQSFVSSDELLLDKVNHDLSFFHKKGSHDDADEIETSYTARTNKHKVIDMRKMLARSDIDKSKFNYRNEEQFNNYFQTQSKPRMSLDFQKHIGRKSNSNRYVNDPELLDGERVSKVYQKMLFDQGNNGCFVDYKKYGKFKPHPTSDESPSYQLQKLRRGESFTKKCPFSKQLQFYQGNGRADPSQLDNRIVKDNEYFWKGVRSERERIKDYSVNKRKEDQQLKKLQQVLSRKRPMDDRNDMCDEKYFRRQH